MNIRSANLASTIPFDTKKLDDLLEAAGIDVLIATSKHNVGYLLGGYRFFFFETMDAIGINRYLPAFIYARGQADRSVFIGNKLEGFEKQLNRFWTPVAETSWMTGPEVDAIGRLACQENGHRPRQYRRGNAVPSARRRRCAAFRLPRQQAGRCHDGAGTAARTQNRPPSLPFSRKLPNASSRRCRRPSGRVGPA